MLSVDVEIVHLSYLVTFIVKIVGNNFSFFLPMHLFEVPPKYSQYQRESAAEHFISQNLTIGKK